MVILTKADKKFKFVFEMAMGVSVSQGESGLFIWFWTHSPTLTSCWLQSRVHELAFILHDSPPLSWWSLSFQSSVAQSSKSLCY